MRRRNRCHVRSAAPPGVGAPGDAMKTRISVRRLWVGRSGSRFCLLPAGHRTGRSTQKTHSRVEHTHTHAHTAPERPRPFVREFPRTVLRTSRRTTGHVLVGARSTVRRARRDAHTPVTKTTEDPSVARTTLAASRGSFTRQPHCTLTVSHTMNGQLKPPPPVGCAKFLENA